MTAAAPTERQLEVAIYAARTTDKAAAEHFAMPRRTVTNIRNRWQDTPEFRIARARLSAKLADQYAELEQLAIDRAKTALQDADTPARDVASLGKWISEQRALTTGDVTRRTETNAASDWTAGMSDDERHEVAIFLRNMVDASDDELRDYLASADMAKHFGRWKVPPDEEATDVG